jgi:hypothetical protein
MRFSVSINDGDAPIEYNRQVYISCSNYEYGLQVWRLGEVRDDEQYYKTLATEETVNINVFP